MNNRLRLEWVWLIPLGWVRFFLATLPQNLGVAALAAPRYISPRHGRWLSATPHASWDFQWFDPFYKMDEVDAGEEHKKFLKFWFQLFRLFGIFKHFSIYALHTLLKSWILLCATVSCTCYRTSHSKMLTWGVLKTIGIKHFNKRTAEAIIGWHKERSITTTFERSWILSLSRVWIQISQKSISAKVGVVCSWLIRRRASAKVVVWPLGI